MRTDGKSVKKACDKRAYYLEELHEDDTADILEDSLLRLPMMMF